MNDSESAVLTVLETSKLLRLGRTSTYDAIRRMEIPSIKVGSRILVPRAALLRLLQDAGKPQADATTD